MDGDDFTVCPDGEGRLEPNGWKNKGDMWCYTNGKKRCIKPIGSIADSAHTIYDPGETCYDSGLALPFVDKRGNRIMPAKIANVLKGAAHVANWCENLIKCGKEPLNSIDKVLACAAVETYGYVNPALSCLAFSAVLDFPVWNSNVTTNRGHR